MPMEIDFAWVGDGSRSGDAIAFRIGNLAGPREEQIVCVVDGGAKDSGERLVSIIREAYHTDWLDAVFLTHPDADHASGVTVVLEQLKVKALLMHKPWEHAANVKSILQTPLTEQRMQNRLVRALSNAHELYQLAVKKGIPIHEPFAGELTLFGGKMTILGPTREYYCHLLAQFREVPTAPPTLLGRAVGAISEAVARMKETFGVEALDDSGETSAENNSSMILHVTDPSARVLFTGDAGISALTHAANFADARGIALATLNGFQVPHHGSKRNVGPTILNRIRAPVAWVSAAKEGPPKHPAQRVLNALIRRNTRVFTTAGTNMLQRYETLPRPGWNAEMQPAQFVEDYDE